MAGGLRNLGIAIGEFWLLCAIIGFVEPSLADPMLYVAGTSAALSIAAYASTDSLFDDPSPQTKSHLAKKWLAKFRDQYKCPVKNQHRLCSVDHNPNLDRRCAASQVTKMEVVGSLRDLATSPLTRSEDIQKAKDLFLVIVEWETFIANNTEVLQPYTSRGQLYRDAIYPCLGAPIVTIPGELIPATWASATSAVGDVGICTFLSQLQSHLQSTESTEDWTLIILAAVAVWQQLYLDSLDSLSVGCSAYYPVTKENPAFAAVVTDYGTTISTLAPNMLWYIFAHAIYGPDAPRSLAEPTNWSAYFKLVSQPNLDKVKSFVEKRSGTTPLVRPPTTLAAVGGSLEKLARILSETPSFSRYRISSGYEERMKNVIESTIAAGGNNAEALISDMTPIISDKRVQKSLREVMQGLIGNSQPTVVLPPRPGQLSEYQDLLKSANHPGGACRERPKLVAKS